MSTGPRSPTSSSRPGRYESNRVPGAQLKALSPESAGNGTVHVITAWNPRGRTASAHDNARAQGLLLDEIRSRALTWWSAEGGDACGTHREESVAVVGLSDAAARELGRHFGQDAIFAWTLDAWRVLSCDSKVVAVSGWVASESGRLSSLRPSGDAGRDRSDGSSERHLGES
ncbi:DUF3293 domain-containing protein [Streptomyces sp. NPDC007883]|uniref:DUF3293 domain-containing protein n=1 Tax=Streptomyces sp. NPDC007883 TaxID=3155116 RepID=UPI003400CE69